MGWNGFVVVLSVFLLISDAPSLSFDLNGRKLVASQPADNSALTQVAPLPNPVPGGQELVSQTSGSSSELTMNTTSPNVTVPTGPHTSDQTDNRSKKEKDNGKKSGPPQGKEVDKKTGPTEGKETDNRMSPPQGKENNKKPTPHEGKEIDKIPSPPQLKDINKKLSPPAEVGNCDGKEKKCLIQNTFTGCIGNFGSDSKELEILIQNDGQETLKVDITVPTKAADNKKDIIVLKHLITKVNISNIIGKASKIVLSTGNKKCEIVIGYPRPEGDAFFHLPNTEKLLTPVNGAYFVILTVVTLGGVWACCRFTNRRRHGSVPYQELEMASPETVPGAYVETAEGWDQGWDDDWDEENSLKFPVVRLHMGNISANGLSSQPAKRDGWENDWNE